MPGETDLDDRQLIQRAREGDAAAERALFDAHVDRVFRLAYRLSGDQMLAEDFTQNTFLRAYERLSEFRGEASFSTWLHAIAVSVTLNGLRRVRRRRAHETPLEDPDAGVPVPPARPGLRSRLVDAIDGLSEARRVVFVMHDIEGFKHHEIADALGVPVGTSKARLSRAREQLRIALGEQVAGGVGEIGA
jgi:RNA polymerase sigma-70 factor (ECF subfamily)